MALNGGTFRIFLDFLRGRNTAATQRSLDELGKTTKKAGKAAKSARQNFNDLAGAFTGIMAAKAVKQALTGFIKPAADMQQSMASIGALTGATGNTLTKFKNKAIETAGKVIGGPTSLSNALLRLYQVTGDAQTAIDALEPTAFIKMASAGRVSMEQAVEFMGDAIKTFGFSGEQATDAMERIFAVSKRTGVPLENLSQNFFKLREAALLGGQSFDEI